MTATLDTSLFTRPDTDRTWALPASIVNTDSPIRISAVTVTEYSDRMLNDAFASVLYSMQRSHGFHWYNLPPHDNPLRAFFDNSSAFYTALRPITNTRFSKAVENYIYKTYKLRLDATAKAELGRIGASFGQTISDRLVDYTDTFDWQPGDFGDNGSCYWNDNYYNHSRVRDFPRLGAYAIRAWDNRNYGIGRAWIVPVPRKLAPDFPTFQVMNAYGSFKDLQPHPAFILARHLTDLTGVKWRVPESGAFRVYDAHSNGDSKLVIPADANMPDNWRDDYVTIYPNDVELPIPDWARNDRAARCKCADCGEYFNADDLDGDDLCEDCAEDRANRDQCECCGNSCYTEDMYYVESAGERYCEHCYTNNFVYIERLDTDVQRDCVIWIAVGNGDITAAYADWEYGEVWDVCNFTMTPILLDNAVTVEDADGDTYIVTASLADRLCTAMEGREYPVLIAPVDTFRTADYYDHRALRYALSHDAWRRLGTLKEPRPLHWLDLPTQYTADINDELTIKMDFAAA